MNPVLAVVEKNTKNVVLYFKTLPTSGVGVRFKDN